MVLIGLLSRGPYGHACRIGHLHRRADLEVIFGLKAFSSRMPVLPRHK
jgi:hypothetical protein